jgi:hypothetical protein
MIRRHIVGEAKRRGSFEQRKTAALAKREVVKILIQAAKDKEPVKLTSSQLDILTLILGSRPIDGIRLVRRS